MERLAWSNRKASFTTSFTTFEQEIVGSNKHIYKCLPLSKMPGKSRKTRPFPAFKNF